MRHLVVGTAGHIDHGKSALVRALTGTDPDRLAEEKRRGITIELGFADLELDEGRSLSFVDVPGHERFVRQMVAGASGIEAVMLVVAADQGVQPQTREHLDICSLLAVPRGVVALTKCDLVDEELREVVALELRELLEGGFLAGAPIVAVSARDGDGLDGLRAALGDLFADTTERSNEGVARLPVDRTFVMRGFGSVATGTLVSGRLREGDEVEVLPGGARARVRGLQVHGRATREAAAGRRTAVNLQGVDTASVPRGATVSAPGALVTTRRVWARVRLLDRAPRDLQRGGPVRFHAGTSDLAARMRPLGSDTGGLHVELRLESEAVVTPGDRFILRRPAPVDTIGGGVVVDAEPPPARAYVAELFDDAALCPEALLATRLRRAADAGLEPARVAPTLGLSAAQVEDALVRLEQAGKAARAGARRFDGATWAEIGARCLAEVETFHAEQPLRVGVSREALRGRLCRAMPQESWRELLEQRVRSGELRLEGDLVALAGHRVVLAGEELELAERIEERLRVCGLEPPDAETLEQEQPRLARDVIEQLVARGRLVRIRDGRLFHADALEQLRRRLRDHARVSRTIDVAAFKQLAGVTRKNAIPLLEQLDAERTTRRVGDRREILVGPDE